MTVSVTLWRMTWLLLPTMARLVFAAVAVVALTASQLPGGQRVLLRLWGARAASHDELVVLQPTLALLRDRGVLGGPVTLLITPIAGQVAARAVGRRTIVVTAGLITAARPARAPSARVATVLGRESALLALGVTRCDVTLALLTLPWEVIAATGRALIGTAQGLPVVSLAWSARALVGGACLYLAVQERDGLYAGAALVVALTYLVPWWARRWEATRRRLGEAALRESQIARPRQQRRRDILSRLNRRSAHSRDRGEPPTQLPGRKIAEQPCARFPRWLTACETRLS